MHRTLLLFLLPLALLTSARADFPEGSAAYMAEMDGAKAEYFGKLLERRHSELVSVVTKVTNENDTYIVDSLNKQHEEWKKYKSADCQLIGALELSIWNGSYGRRIPL